MQLNSLLPQFNTLHSKHGDPKLSAIYGAGQTVNPRIALIFMNPTDKNVSSNPAWNGLRAPWIGTKNVWRLLHKLNLFTNSELASQIQAYKPQDWTPEFADQVYQAVKEDSLYITNISKATTIGAVPVSNTVYKEFLPSMLQELEQVDAQYIFALGNQVSSVLLQKPTSVSNYLTDESEEIVLQSGTTLKIHPAYYPVGQGQRNMALTVARLQKILG